MAKTYSLTETAKRKLERLIDSSNAGRPQLSRRPPPTSRRSVWCERPRLIRGQSVGAQSTATILIDNIVELAAGIDPSASNTATQIRVANRFLEVFADNAEVWAIYSPGVVTTPIAADWETVKAGTEKFRGIVGLVRTHVAAQATDFLADTIVPIEGGLDPVNGNPNAVMTILKSQKESLRAGQQFQAHYFAPTAQWLLAPVERNRAIRGQVFTSISGGSGTFSGVSIVVLQGGTDPRLNPNNAAEQVIIQNIHSQDYAAGEHFEADWRSSNGTWEARKKAVQAAPPAATGIRYGIVPPGGVITAASGIYGGNITSGSGPVREHTYNAGLDKWTPNALPATTWFNNVFGTITELHQVWGELHPNGKIYVTSQSCALTPTS